MVVLKNTLNSNNNNNNNNSGNKKKQFYKRPTDKNDKKQEILNSKGVKVIIGETDLRTKSLGTLSILEDQILLNVIFNEFSCSDLLKYQSVSPAFYILLGDDRLWKDAFFREIKGRKDLVKYIDNWKISALSYLYPNSSNKFNKPYIPLHFSDFYSHEIYTRWLRRHMKVKDYGIDFGHVKHIETDELTVEEFQRDYEIPSIPVIFKNAQKGTSMMEKGEWSEERLLERCGDVVFKISHQENKRIPMTFRDYCHYMKTQTDEEPLYVFDQAFGEKVPSLLDDYIIPKFFPEDLFKYNGEQRPHFRWIVIGPERSGASWHIDPAGTSAWNSLISGRKRWLMYPPNFTPYTVESDDVVDKIYGSPPSLLWLLEVYPYIPPDYRPIECIQEPGETIFVPGGWWHMVLNMEQSIAVTQNFCNSQNFDEVCNDLANDEKKDYDDFKKHLLNSRPDFQDRFNQFEFKNDQFNHSFDDTDYWDLVIKSILNNSNLKYNEKIINTNSDDNKKDNENENENEKEKEKEKDNEKEKEKENENEKEKELIRDENRKEYDEDEKSDLKPKSKPIKLPPKESTLHVEMPTSGQSPVFIIDDKYVIKLYCSELGGEKSWSTELFLYSKIKENSQLNSTFPKLLAFGNIKDLLGDKLQCEWKWPYIVTEYLNDTLNLQDVQPVPDSLPYPYPPPVEDDEDEDDDQEDEDDIKVLDDRLVDFLVEKVSLIHSIEINDTDEEVNEENIKSLLKEYKTDKWLPWKNQLLLLDSKYISNHWNWNGLPTHLRSQLNSYLPVDKTELIDHSMDPCFIHADLTDENVLGIESTSEIIVLEKIKKLKKTPKSAKKGIKQPSSLSSRLKQLKLKVNGKNNNNEDDDEDCEVTENKKTIKIWDPKFLIDWGDSKIGDRWYELVSLYISVFALDKIRLKSFLSKYKLPNVIDKSWLDYYNENPQAFIKRAMQYTLIHHCDAFTTAARHNSLLRNSQTIDELANSIWNLDV
ncbi:hypothetical protein RB653_006786 [Dictyostelium firmibasis]|uniref:JmjC domain-containing protein n=1 Tax=Dictyostelium firmibasis TaxID=79012 RepID=A0AAN7TUF9_9MYCE